MAVMAGKMATSGIAVKQLNETKFSEGTFDGNQENAGFASGTKRCSKASSISGTVSLRTMVFNYLNQVLNLGEGRAQISRPHGRWQAKERRRDQGWLFRKTRLKMTSTFDGFKMIFA